MPCGLHKNAHGWSSPQCIEQLPGALPVSHYGNWAAGLLIGTHHASPPILILNSISISFSFAQVLLHTMLLSRQR